MSQNVFDLRISVRDMTDLIKFGARHNKTIFFYGGAGVGKSQKAKQIADELYPTYLGQTNLVDVRLSDKDPTDVAGVPIPIQMVDGTTQTVYATPSFWPKDPNWKGIIFLDELTNASAACQQAAYQIMLDHTIGEFKFPEGAVFVGAGNRDGDGGCTTTLLSPLVNRMVIVEVDYNLDVWLEDFAIPNELHPSLLGALKKTLTDKFYTGDSPTLEPGHPYATPRSWVTVSDALYDLDEGIISRKMAEVIIQGSVGKGLDSEILAFHDRVKKLPDIEEVLNGNVTRHQLGLAEVDLLFVMSQALTNQLRKDCKSDMDDEVVLDRANNFLVFMNDNYASQHMDVVVTLTIGMFRGTGNKPSVLGENTAREKMIPRLNAKSSKVREIVAKYLKDYSSLMKDVDMAA